MIVTVFRHGEASEARTDRERELTGQGRDDVGFACQQLHEACKVRGLPHPDRILHSPWVRTLQSADILAAAYSHATQSPMDALRPEGDVSGVDGALADLIGSLSGGQHLLLVSHQPLVSRLLDHYLGEAGRVPGLSPGGLATLELEIAAPACGKLLFWALPPEYEVGI